MPEIDVVVRSMKLEADGIVSVTLGDAEGSPLPGWTPGAHIDIRCGSGPIRQYSLCGDLDDRRCYRIGVLREIESRGGSQFIHDALRVGDRVGISAPRNNFELKPGPAYLFIAGGIGITPILPMIRTIAKTDKPWHLLYGGRTRRSMAFLDELAFHGDKVTQWPQDRKGLLPVADWLARPEWSHALVYCCGPGPLIDAVTTACEAQAARSLYVERFQPLSSEVDGDVAFRVKCAKSGLELVVGPDQSLLTVLEDAGVRVDYSCTQGICGACETRVLAGTPDHRDSVLSQAERASNRTMMICVSRAKSDELVLDC